MRPEIQATAEGDLGRTPFAHLLVYAIDRRLTGALFLTTPEGVEHVVRLSRGAPVKVKVGDEYAQLGAVLVELGLVRADVIRAALTTKGLLGEVLVLLGHVDEPGLARAVEAQLVRRLIHLFALPPETAYAYYDGHAALLDWGGEPTAVDPLRVIWAGLRAHANASASMEGTLARLGDAPLKLHLSSTVERFGLEAGDRAAVEALAAQPVSLAELVASGVAPEATLRTLAYALLITRQIDTGANTMPVGADDAREPAPTPSGGSAALGRINLRTATHRVGAAAPDPPGDGERVPISTRKSRKRGTSSADGAGPDSSPDAPASGVPSPAAEPRRPAGADRSEPALASPGVEAPKRAAPALSAPALFQLAKTKLAAQDPEGALEACSLAREADPAEADYAALAFWIRGQLPGADVKALTIELDELLRDHDGHLAARYYRGMLRKRLSDDAGALRDFTRLLELDPGHADGAREAAALRARQPKPEAGLLSRLFKR